MKDHRAELGATAVEYALIAALIAGVIVLAVFGFGTGVVTLFVNGCTAFPGASC